MSSTALRTALASSKCHDALLGKHVKGDGVNTLLVDEDEVLPLLADSSLEVQHTSHLVISELSLAVNHLLTLTSVRVEEASSMLRPLILERHVRDEDVAVAKGGGHVRVAGTVIEDESVDERRVSSVSVLHVHHLHHVQVGRLALLGDAAEGLYNVLSHLISQLRHQLRPQ